jgi:hypothetical protein
MKRSLVMALDTVVVKEGPYQAPLANAGTLKLPTNTPARLQITRTEISFPIIAAILMANPLYGVTPWTAIVMNFAPPYILVVFKTTSWM